MAQPNDDYIKAIYRILGVLEASTDMSRDATLRNSVFRALYKQDLYGFPQNRFNLRASAKNSLDYVQRLGLMCQLPIHSGCVNTVHWNSSGEYLISGSDDLFLAVTNLHNQEVLLKYKTLHRGNIFSARFMPQSNDQAIVSCSGDGTVLHTELMAPYIRRVHPSTYPSSSVGSQKSPPIYERVTQNDTNVSFFNCHKNGITYEVLTAPTEPHSFMSCGEDATVRSFDLRHISCCHKICCRDNILILSPAAVNAMDLAPISNHYLAVGSSDAIVRIYDRRYLSEIDFTDDPANERHTRPVKAYTIPLPLPNKRHYRITCIRYSPEESELLVSYSSEYLYLFDLKRDGVNVNDLQQNKLVERSNSPPTPLSAEFVTRRLRLRGDWSDTGPEARPERDANGRSEASQFRPQLQANIMNRMTEVISRMLSDPRTRLGLSNQLQDNLTNPDSSPNAALNDNDINIINTYARPSTSRAAWRRAAFRSLGLSSHSGSTNTTTTSTTNRSDIGTSPSPATMADGDLDNMTTTATTNTSLHTNENDGNKTTITTSRTTTTTSSPYQRYDDDAVSINQELADLEMDTSGAIFDYVIMKYTGHRNARTMIKEATFWGNDYIMSGSDCGHIFTWNRHTGKLVMLMQADQHVVNCVQPHPQLPYLATSGIDYDVKIWAPILHERAFDDEKAQDLMKRNAIMLEQTKDTITVPAAFMIRLLSCIHSLRNRQRNANTEQESSADAVNDNATQQTNNDSNNIIEAHDNDDNNEEVNIS